MPDQGEQRPTLTVAVLTLNEAKRIRACLASASFADQLLVVDSGSTDATVQIAQEMGAEVFVYPDWQGFAVQRNRILKHAHGDYILFLDADEELNPAFQEELKEITASKENAVWKIRWKMVAFGQVLKHLRTISWVERLFLRENIIEFVGVVHEKAMLKEEVARKKIKSPILHHSRASVKDGMQKMTQYAVLGAAKRAKQGKKGGVVRGVFAAISMFFRVYLLHFGFASGGAGFLYSAFVALEAFFRYAVLGYDEVIEDNLKR